MLLHQKKQQRKPPAVLPPKRPHCSAPALPPGAAGGRTPLSVSREAAHQPALRRLRGTATLCLRGAARPDRCRGKRQQPPLLLQRTAPAAGSGCRCGCGCGLSRLTAGPGLRAHRESAAAANAERRLPPPGHTRYGTQTPSRRDKPCPEHPPHAATAPGDSSTSVTWDNK